MRFPRFNLFLQAEFIFNIKVVTNLSLSNVVYILYLVIHCRFSPRFCGATESVSKVSVCFPSGIYIGIDRQCDK